MLGPGIRMRKNKCTPPPLGKQACSTTETSWKKDFSLVASLDITLFYNRIIKALIGLRGCAGWSVPLLFANPRRQVFSRRGPDYLRKPISAWTYPVGVGVGWGSR